ncbi:unnamed protein product [Darwinula stevensoni]|uniref:Corrinoid adenosyltransferase MMAB n=1 Tax=Darwinula stevensoni TaxID=69355 RepID=A0A7R8X473_9CRUS|nr:unnamed protein product [Darwinula stevensoni]CAG0883318.1 unnamed protein product [Darwinula stevensoni]
MILRTPLMRMLPLAGTSKIMAMSKKQASTKIYTRTGDKGKTSTYTGERRLKSDPIFNALGTLDELTSHIGLVSASATKGEYMEQLKRIQCILQDIGSLIATPRSSAKEKHAYLTEFDKSFIEDMEAWIDAYTDHLPPLKAFILPGGTVRSAQIHIARSVCRRAERSILPLVIDEEVDPKALAFVNRLSDYLFTLARFVCHEEGGEETSYRKPRPHSEGHD